MQNTFRVVRFYVRHMDSCASGWSMLKFHQYFEYFLAADRQGAEDFGCRRCVDAVLKNLCRLKVVAADQAYQSTL